MAAQVNAEAVGKKENKKNEGILKVDIKSLATLGKAVSPTFKIGGLKWKIEVSQEKLDPTTGVSSGQQEQQQLLPALHFRLVANWQLKDKLWWTQSQYTCHYKMGTQIHRTQKYHPFYSFNGHCEEIANLRQEWDLQLFNGAFQIVVVLKVMKSVSYGLPSLDTQITVNNEHMAVNKYILYAYSPVLRQYFENWPKEKETNLELLLDANADMDAFKAMVYGVHVFGGSLEDKDLLDYNLAKNILGLAVKYEFDVWANCCEQFLIANAREATHHHKMELLELANRWGRKELKEYCLANIDPLEYLENNDQNDVICPRLSKRTRTELNARLKESVKRVRHSLSIGANNKAMAGNE